MSSLNKVQLIGRVGKDPELRQTGSGKMVANFSVATSITSKQETNDYGKASEQTEWHKITVWDKLAENCKKFLAKGKLCYVEGRLATRSFEKDGQQHYSTEIIAHSVLFLSPKEADKLVTSSTPADSPSVVFPSLDDIPF